MSHTRRSVLAAGVGQAFASAALTHPARAGAGPASGLAETARRLAARSAEGNAALMRGDAARYFSLVPLAHDFTLMSPFGGAPSHGTYTSERQDEIGRFFRNGTFEQDVVRSYASADMVVLVVLERAHVEVGGLPAQEWALRVTLVYRRDGDQWRLAHRHADPLAPGISVPQAASLARGEPLGTGRARPGFEDPDGSRMT